MNKDLAEVIKLYATADHSAVTKYLRAHSKDSVSEILLALMTMYFNDKNSSTLREYILVTSSGFTPNEEKLGYNGYQQVTIAGRQVRKECEAKPKNISTHDKKSKKLSGDGGFNDYTFARFKKHKCDNPTVLVGGFIDGKLIYICRFPFDSPRFTARLEEQLRRHFPEGKDVKGRYLRSAAFGLRNYQDAEDLLVDIFVSDEELDERKDHITRNLFAFLKKQSEKDGE